MPKDTASWPEIIHEAQNHFQSDASGVFQAGVLEFCVQNHLTLLRKINICCDSDRCSKQESDHIRPSLCIRPIDATEGCDFIVQWALRKNIFSITVLLNGRGFLMIYDQSSVCDHLSSKNCKLLCGCPTFTSVHMQISIFMDTSKCGFRLKQDRAHSRGPLWLH